MSYFLPLRVTTTLRGADAMEMARMQARQSPWSTCDAEDTIFLSLERVAMGGEGSHPSQPSNTPVLILVDTHSEPYIGLQHPHLRSIMGSHRKLNKYTSSFIHNGTPRSSLLGPPPSPPPGRPAGSLQPPSLPPARKAGQGRAGCGVVWLREGLGCVALKSPNYWITGGSVLI
jgi:hypothetical protein